MPPERKAATAKDRLEPEAYALAQDRERDALKRIRDEEMTEEARQQVRLANRALQREKEALRLQREEQEQRQRDLDKQASIILSAKNATGQPVSPDLEHLGTQAKGRRRPQQQQGE
jgi:putative cell wall-binding protein